MVTASRTRGIFLCLLLREKFVLHFIMSLQKPSTMLSDAFGTLVVRVIGIVLMFVSTTLTARLLGPDEYGTYSAAFALALLLATLAPLGSDRILVRNLATMKSPAEIGQETAITHLGTAWMVSILFCGLLSFWFLSQFVLDNAVWARTSLLAAIMFVPLTAIYLRQWLAIPLIGTRHAVLPEQTLLPLFFTAMLLAAVSVGLHLTASITAAVYASVTVLVWTLSLRSRALRTAYQSAIQCVPGIQKSAVIRRIIEGTAYVAVAIGAIVSQSCMPLTIAATCGFKETAYYALAMPFGALPAIPLGVFNLTMFPRCARLYQNGQLAEANHTVRSAATMTFGLSLGVAVVVWIGSPLLITVLGVEYTTVCVILPALLLAAVVDSLTGPTMPVMQTMKMEKTYSHMLIASVPMQLGLIYILGNVASVEGCALGYMVSRILWNIAVVIRIRKMRGLIMLPYVNPARAWQEFQDVAQTGSSQRYPHQVDSSKSHVVPHALCLEPTPAASHQRRVA